MADITYSKPLYDQVGPELYTWQDLITELADWAQIANSGLTERRLRTATLNAMRDLCHRKDWKFLVEQVVVPIQGAIDIVGSYDHTGGASERLFTVTSGTLPASIGLWNVVIGTMLYEIESSSSGTTFNLMERSNPNIDVASGSVKLVRNIYPVPYDFVRGFDPEASTRQRTLTYLSPDDYAGVTAQRHNYGDARYWTVGPHDRLLSPSRAIKVFPYPTLAKNLSLFYHKTARPLRISGYASGEYGTFTLDTGTNARRATLVGIPVTTKLVGSALRMRSDTNVPENVDGKYPYDVQAIIMSVDAGSSYVFLDRDMAASSTAKACVVSDPVDVPEYMLNALKDACKYEYAKLANKGMEIVGPLRGLYGESLLQAAESDSGYKAGTGTRYPFIHFQDDVAR